MSERAEYERRVRTLAEWAEDELAAGRSIESVAREAVTRRNALTREFRTGLPPDLLRLLEIRNVRLYDDPVGPSADALLKRYGSWQRVLEAAARHASFDAG